MKIKYFIMALISVLFIPISVQAAQTCFYNASIVKVSYCTGASEQSYETGVYYQCTGCVASLDPGGKYVSPTATPLFVCGKTNRGPVGTITNATFNFPPPSHGAYQGKEYSTYIVTSPEPSRHSSLVSIFYVCTSKAAFDACSSGKKPPLSECSRP